MITLKSVLACAVALGVGFSAATASAAEKSRLWEFDITTTSGSEPAASTATWVCLADSQLASPPDNLTGPICEGQTFFRERDVLTWTAACNAATGSGRWEYSRGDKAVEGLSQMQAEGVIIRTQVEGKVQDRCG